MADLATGQSLGTGQVISITCLANFSKLYHLKSLQKSSLPSDPILLPTANGEGKDQIGINNNENSNKLKFVDLMKQNNIVQHTKRAQIESISMKPVEYNNEIPRITWTEEKVRKMNTIKDLQYAVVGKFSYDWPELDDLRHQIPKQCKTKGES
ncbi:hypothetical protein FXO38_31547 [Capsicum annuum]|nr:hypothetical protein FXO38_31547 [Capsicum annuum]KAF3641279.1 hypothetical protein FXO37_23082 [Capsicum annuum]